MVTVGEAGSHHEVDYGGPASGSGANFFLEGNRKAGVGDGSCLRAVRDLRFHL